METLMNISKSSPCLTEFNLFDVIRRTPSSQTLLWRRNTRAFQGFKSLKRSNLDKNQNGVFVLTTSRDGGYSTVEDDKDMNLILGKQDASLNALHFQSQSGATVETDSTAVEDSSTHEVNGREEEAKDLEGEEKSQTKVTHNIVFVTSEAAPYSKTGGLGDVCGSLPIALAAREHRVMVVSPRYVNGGPSDKNYAGAKDLNCRIKISCFGGLQEVSFFHEYRAGVDWVSMLYVLHLPFK
ncbi:Starch synthase 1, chloroplastic/amyloplastic [Thalictrum thalictroides]|uniref:Starch synthase 1, chloroplastic/amyloplastic n=1 Tax=Thalictrum thalictroides TaxID=46969 RepID=A0A7J6VGY6_THATH|nr:Starch synthase 1, chloroplastic/amyloplastic [Thalictrum thalictroides]